MADDDDAGHEHGTMDATEQEQTFESFVWWIRTVVIVVIAILVFLALAAT